MTGTPESSPLGTAQRWVLVLIAVALAFGLVILRGGIQSESPMEQLARRSLDPQTALTNGRPTLIEYSISVGRPLVNAVCGSRDLLASCSIGLSL